MVVDLVIKNGKIVGVEGIYEAGIAIEDGTIVNIAKEPHLPNADIYIDAKRNYIFPGAIDPHVHLGIYSGDLKEEVKTETAGAAHGGTTAIIHFLQDKGSYKEKIPQAIDIVNKNALIDIAFHATIGTEQQIHELEEYIKAGVTSFKFFLNRPEYESKFGQPYLDDGQLMNAWRKISNLGGLPMCHCENYEITKVITEQLRDKDPYPGMWNDCRPWYCEYEAMQRAYWIAKIAKSPLYIVHTSIGSGIDIAFRSLTEGLPIFIETCPHYLTLHSSDPKLFKIEKINPPLRTKEDIERLWWGIKHGLVHCIGTDHTAIKYEKKWARGDFWEIPLDWNSIETMFPIVLTEAIKRGLPLTKVVEICAYNASKIFGLAKKGNISIGKDADIIIVDLKNKIKWSAEKMVGYGDFTLYDGWELIWPLMTISKGNIVWRDEQIDWKIGNGKFIYRKPTRW